MMLYPYLLARETALNCVPPTPEVSGYSLQQSRYNSGDYVLVKYVTRKTEYYYAAICSSVDDEEGELRVTFLKFVTKTVHCLNWMKETS